MNIWQKLNELGWGETYDALDNKKNPARPSGGQAYRAGPGDTQEVYVKLPTGDVVPAKARNYTLMDQIAGKGERGNSEILSINIDGQEVPYDKFIQAAPDGYTPEYVPAEEYRRQRNRQREEESLRRVRGMDTAAARME